uniref:MYM-type domain-containing protein n=1 Tax=viral metagenome TaxID=1070528 RepID=A0A6C0D7X1_9ZZZZ
MSEININPVVPIKSKRGRKPKDKNIITNIPINLQIEPKNDISQTQNVNLNVFSSSSDSLTNNNEFELQVLNDVNSELNSFTKNENENTIIKPPPKKRGRKPKGGKIIQQILPVVEQKESKPNIILHLKCNLKDLNTTGDYNSNFTCSNIDSYHFSNSNELSYEIISNPELNLNCNNCEYINNDKHFYTINNCNNKNNNDNFLNNDNDNINVDTETFQDNQYNDVVETKDIWRKLKNLEQNFHINNISNKKSACFWCSYDFDNPPIYIPKHFVKESYHVYGCFCTPECAVAFLMEENIDSSTKFERYYLINHIYSKIYKHEKNIKPAPNPHYMLDKFYGNLTIQEYRALLKSEKLFLIVDKPLTRILPEFHEDNDDFIITNKIIPSNNFQLKKKIQRKQQTKNNILNEKFGIITN